MRERKRHTTKNAHRSGLVCESSCWSSRLLCCVACWAASERCASFPSRGGHSTHHLFDGHVRDGDESQRKSKELHFSG